MYITTLVKQVYLFISRVSGGRLQDHWSSGLGIVQKTWAKKKMSKFIGFLTNVEISLHMKGTTFSTNHTKSLDKNVVKVVTNWAVQFTIDG